MVYVVQSYWACFGLYPSSIHLIYSSMNFENDRFTNTSEPEQVKKTRVPKSIVCVGAASSPCNFLVHSLNDFKLKGQTEIRYTETINYFQNSPLSHFSRIRAATP
jgi:hypothetical protein